MVTVLVRPGRGASQVEKSPRLNWATQFLTMAYDGACSLNVFCRMAWISFWALPYKKKKTLWHLASLCCWNRVLRPTCFLSASIIRKDLQFGTWTDPSFQRHYRFRPTRSGSRSDYSEPLRRCSLNVPWLCCRWVSGLCFAVGTFLQVLLGESQGKNFGGKAFFRVHGKRVILLTCRLKHSQTGVVFLRTTIFDHR